MNKLFAGIYNFFHIFKKDEGAHFAYDLGVGLMRAGVAAVFIGIMVFVMSRCINSFSMKRLEEVRALVKVERIEDEEDDPHRPAPYDTYFAHFDCTSYEGKQFHVDEAITFDMYNALSERAAIHDPQEYVLYRVTFNRRQGEELYLTEQSKTNTMLCYARCHDERLPISLAGMWVAFSVALLLFLMGRKQMRIGLKYPRSDVPEVLSGAPVAVPDGSRQSAGQMNTGTMALPLTETENE